MRTLAIANGKGGVGKSTTTVQLATAWARRGLRVLVLDLDPGAGATALLGAAPGTGMANVLRGIEPIPDAAIPTDAGPDLVPGGPALASAEVEMAGTMGREGALTRAAGALPADRYDVALIDCGPTLGILVANALGAADALLVPLRADFLSLHAWADFSETIRLARERLNPELDLVGLVLVDVDRRQRATAETREILRRHKAPLLDTEIRTDARLRGSPDGGPKGGRAFADYQKLADDVGRRLGLEHASKLAPGDASESAPQEENAA